MTLPADTDEIEYSKSGDEVQGGTVVVTATSKKPGHFFAEDLAGWTVSEDRTVATKTINLANVPCDAVTVTPVDPTVHEAECSVPGSPTTPSITLPTTTGVTYLPPEGEFAQGKTVTVTAQANEGYKFPATVPGWTVSADGKTATWTVTFEVISCDAEVVPVQPSVSGNECVDGVYTGPSVSFSGPAGVSYTDLVVSDLDQGTGEYTVTVTATITAANTVWADDLGVGWTKVDETTASYSGTIKANLCEPEQDKPVAPVDPDVVQPVCDEETGVVSKPEVKLSTTAGIVYTVEGDFAPGGTVEVTATPEDGYVLIETSGWDLDKDTGTASKTITFDDPVCQKPEEPAEVAPVDPDVVQATCDDDGDVVDPVVTPVVTEGVTYVVQGEVKAGETVTVVATPEDGFKLVGAEGWTLNEDGTATRTIVLDPVDCQTPEEPKQVKPQDPTVDQPVCDEDGNMVDPQVTPAVTEVWSTRSLAMSSLARR